MCVRNQLKFLQTLWLQRLNGQFFDQKIYQKVEIVAGGEGTCEAEFKVEPEHANIAGILHGGFSASLVDTISTMALLTHPRQTPGVSVNMNLTYLNGAQIGDTVLVKAKTDKVGKSMAFLSVQIVNKENGSVLVQGSHTKYMP